MRDEFHRQLDRLADQLTTMTRMVELAVIRSTEALLTANLTVAERVISGDVAIDEMQTVIEEEAFDQLALQQPVASDLRALVASLRVVADLERMGDLAEHVADVARLRYPEVAVPAELHPVFRRMGELAADMVRQCGTTVEAREIDAAEMVIALDDEMDRLRGGLFRATADASWRHGVEAAIDVALLGRYYERIADHAVSIARRVVYQVTGAYPPLEVRAV